MYRGVPEDAGISVLGRSSFVSEQFFYFAVSPGEPKSLMESLMAENNAVLVNIRVYSVRYRCGCHTEVSGTGIDVVPNLPNCPVPVLMLYRTYRSVRYRYGCRTELTEVFGAGIDIAPNLPKCPVPVLTSDRCPYRYTLGCMYRRYMHRVYPVLPAVYAEYSRHFTAVPARYLFVCCSKGILWKYQLKNR